MELSRTVLGVMVYAKMLIMLQIHQQHNQFLLIKNLHHYVLGSHHKHFAQLQQIVLLQEKHVNLAIVNLMSVEVQLQKIVHQAKFVRIIFV